MAGEYEHGHAGHQGKRCKRPQITVLEQMTHVEHDELVLANCKTSPQLRLLTTDRGSEAPRVSAGPDQLRPQPDLPSLLAGALRRQKQNVRRPLPGGPRKTLMEGRHGNRCSEQRPQVSSSQ